MVDLNPRSFQGRMPASSAERPDIPLVIQRPVEHLRIGEVVEIAGSSSQVLLDAARLQVLVDHNDPSVSMAGQVGSQVKIRMGNRWLVANVRTQRMHQREAGLIVCQIDFLGEGEEEKLTGRIFNFRRGVTRYPVPGTPLYAMTSADLKQVYAADARPHIEIGTVYPTSDTRGALYVDALLGKHFALLGSTGTGKSTAAALILHRICDMMPDGHIVMIDPHGEYSSAFAQNGELFDVGNLAMPYWLMNFEEHCEVFLTSHGADRQTDAEILAKCLLAARMKSKQALGNARVTVDTPIPYMLSDLVANIHPVQNIEIAFCTKDDMDRPRREVVPGPFVEAAMLRAYTNVH